MGIAMLAAKRSKDPNTQVGACIVSQDNIIISTGYNGMPKGCSDDEYPWERDGDQTKYPYVVHAELNAVLNANGRDLRGSKLYVALFPCNECAKAIIQSGVKEVYYLSDKYADTLATMASKRMMDSAGVRYPDAHRDQVHHAGLYPGGRDAVGGERDAATHFICDQSAPGDARVLRRVPFWGEEAGLRGNGRLYVVSGNL